MTGRRYFLRHTTALGLGGGLLVAGCGGLPRGYTVSAAQLLEALTARGLKPQSIGNGLLELHPRITGLRLLPQENRVAAQLAFDASGRLLGGSYPGSFELLFSPRYEASDATLRARDLQLRSLQVAALPSAWVAPLERALPALARVWLGEDVVLHRLRQQDLAPLTALGLQPADLRVTPSGLELGFAPRAAR